MAESKKSSETRMTVTCRHPEYCLWGCTCGLPLRRWCYGKECPPYVKDPDHHRLNFHHVAHGGLCPEIGTWNQCGLADDQHYRKHASFVVFYTPHFRSEVSRALFARYVRRTTRVARDSRADCIPQVLLHLVFSYSCD